MYWPWTGLLLPSFRPGGPTRAGLVVLTLEERIFAYLTPEKAGEESSITPPCAKAWFFSIVGVER